MYSHISVAQAATLINIAVVIVKLTYPLLLSMVTVSVIRSDANAATWSVFGRLINGSLWPAILGTDSAMTTKVDRRVKRLSILSTLATCLLAIATAITPLGLYSRTVKRDNDDVVFTYVKDISPIGRATPSHADYSLNRVCGSLLDVSCPGNEDGYTFIRNGTTFSVTPDGHDGDRADWISSKIATNITTVFDSISANQSTTIAGIFDIHYRSFVNHNNSTRPADYENKRWFDAGRLRTLGRFRYFETFILNDNFDAIEGLIVSTKNNPGIGFRNHTLPPSSVTGYTWTERILWLEPDTACTDLNLTLEYTIPSPDAPVSEEIAQLVDRGGLVDLPLDYPKVDINNTQDDPKLQERSWSAAAITNWIVANALNETRSSTDLGKRYDLKGLQRRDLTPDAIAVAPFGSASEGGSFTPSLPGPLSILRTEGNSTRLDHGTDELDMTVTIGFLGADVIDITKIGVAGGLLLGPGFKNNGDETSTEDMTEYRINPGSNWTHHVYACVAAVKASIKTVVLEMNGTASLSNLIIKDVQESAYGPTEPLPRWAVEDSGRDMASVSPFWGVVAEDMAGVAGIQTLQRPYLYLPAGAKSAVGWGQLDAPDSVAGANAPFDVMSAIYDTSNLGEDSGVQHIPHLTGKTNWALYTKWVGFGPGAQSAGRITNYIWTDIMANTVMGSKSLLRSESGNTPMIERTKATQYLLGVGYDWHFAIPASIFILAYGSLAIWSFVGICTRKITISSLCFFLNQTSPGRAATTERFKADEIDLAETKIWAATRGSETMLLTVHDRAATNRSHCS